jgi:hypothetical protein
MLFLLVQFTKNDLIIWSNVTLVEENKKWTPLVKKTRL